MTSRLKASSFATRAEFDRSLDEIAGLQVDLRAAEAERDNEIQAVREMHERSVLKIADKLKATVVLAEKYAETHRDELFPTAKKSGETTLANYGFRLGNPTLCLLNRKWNWEGVLNAVKAAFPKRFVRTKEDVDKDGLKQHLDAAQLATVGCRIDQAEAFYVEAKEQPNEQKAA
jgi:phage host-nuclease inhibitor protein Gam